MAEKLSKARREMLTDLLDGPKFGVMHYPPNKWALANGYVTVRETRMGANVFTITDAGRLALEKTDDR